MVCPSCATSISAPSRFCPSCGAALGGSTPDASADPLLGQVLSGKYKVVRLLGEGGMGAVYEGEQSLGSAKRKVAVKTLHPHLSRDPKIQARFEREVGTIAELEHPNTIQVYDFGSTPAGILYIVMEFLHGRSIADHLVKEGPMAPERVSHVLDQICGSLEEAHGRGIVHRDLKPDNVVLVERAGHKDFVKVLDFGIAKRSGEGDTDEQRLTQQGMVLGTPPYMSPEQFSGNPVDARSDIYSLGVMAYEMLAGRLPFSANTAWEWAAAHMTKPPVPIESLAEGARVPSAMRAALERALAKSPDQRFQTVGAFAAAFSGRSAGPAPTVADEPMSPPRRSEPEARREVLLATPAPTTARTEITGNVAFPTPASIPEAPPPLPRHSRGGLFAAAGVIAAGSVLAIVFALRGGMARAPNLPMEAVEPAESVPPATSLAPTEPVLEATSASNASDIPPLRADNKIENSAKAVVHAATAAPSKAAAAPALPVPSATTSPTSTAWAPTSAVPPEAPITPRLATPGRYDGPECQRARTLRAFGHRREAQSWAIQCIEKGGSL